MATYLHAAPNGTKRWLVDFVTGGKRYRRAAKDELGRPAKSKTAAEACEYRMRVALAAGAFEVVAPTAESAVVYTLADFRTRFFSEHVAKLKPSSQLAYSVRWRIYLLPTLGSVALAAIDETHVARLSADLRQQELKGKSINLILSALHVAIELAHEWKLRPAPPKFRWEKETDAEIRYFNSDEVSKLVAVGDPMVTVAVKTGLRIGELISLQWRDVNLSKKEVTVSKSTWVHNKKKHEGSTKSGRVRVVPLPASALQALQAMKPKGVAVGAFVFEQDPWLNVLRLRAACEAAGLPRCGWHRLRHSYITALVAANVPLPHVQKLAGHARVEQTIAYSHSNDRDLHAAVSRLD